MLDLTTISEVQIPMDLDLDHEGDMEGSKQDTIKDARMDARDFDGEILKSKSPNFPLNKQEQGPRILWQVGGSDSGRS